jgi:glycosyltransferase involved in cell wall biosynthesis
MGYSVRNPNVQGFALTFKPPPALASRPNQRSQLQTVIRLDSIDYSQLTARPRVSVLMPVFNTGKYIREAVLSIVNQTFSDWELIILDDGSTDGSTTQLESLSSQDSRIRIRKRENLGLIATRNELLGAARGEFIAWMDSDDVSLPERLRMQVLALDADSALTCVGTAVQCVDPEGHPLNIERYPEDHLEIEAEQSQGGAQRFATTMIRRAEALATGGFREPLKIGEDFDFLLRVGEIGKLGNLTKVLYIYRQHVKSVCAAMGPQWPTYRDFILNLARERSEGRKDSLQTGSLPVIERITKRQRVVFESQTYLLWSKYSTENGNKLLGLRYAIAAILRNPLSLLVWRRALKLGLKSLVTV